MFMSQGLAILKQTIGFYSNQGSFKKCLYKSILQEEFMKKIGSIISILAPLALIMLFSGCVAVKNASLEQDTLAKKFLIEKDRSSLYIYRNESFGAAIGMPVVLDGKHIGKTGANTYFRLSVTPGQHTIKSLTENTSELTLNTLAGKNYYVWQEVKMGMWAARSMLQEVDESNGQAAVLECKLLEPDDM